VMSEDNAAFLCGKTHFMFTTASPLRPVTVDDLCARCAAVSRRRAQVQGTLLDVEGISAVKGEVQDSVLAISTARAAVVSAEGRLGEALRLLHLAGGNHLDECVRELLRTGFMQAELHRMLGWSRQRLQQRMHAFERRSTETG
jgi:hypothetical protein